MNVAVLGASNKPERYSFKAVRMLREKGHTPYPVHPALAEVDGLPVFPSLSAIPAAVDTITVYLSPRTSSLSRASCWTAVRAGSSSIRAPRTRSWPGNSGSAARKLCRPAPWCC